MSEETNQLDLLEPVSKEHLKAFVGRSATKWKNTNYNEEAFFADIDNGTITTEKQIDGVFMAARALWL